MVVVQLLASPFMGGPEQQVLGIARHLPAEHRTVFLSFAERGLARPFLTAARQAEFAAIELEQNTPHLWAAVKEVAAQLRYFRADMLCCNGYKSDLVGWLAARRVGIPVVAIAHGWTGATVKVRCYEALDRWVLRRLDHTICVSQAQARKVLAAGVPEEQVTVIPNAIDIAEHAHVTPFTRGHVRALFAKPPRLVVGAAGRLSPEKGFDMLVEAAAMCRHAEPEIGFVLFGDGPQRTTLQRLVAARGLSDHFVFAGFRTDLPRWLPALDLLAMSSHTEGLPVILLEAFAVGLPVVATAVGGIPEVIDEGVSGHLVAPRDPAAMAERILHLASDPATRRSMGQHGRERVRADFSCERQGRAYGDLFDHLLARPHSSFVGGQAPASAPVPR